MFACQDGGCEGEEFFRHSQGHWHSALPGWSLHRRLLQRAVNKPCEPSSGLRLWPSTSRLETSSSEGGMDQMDIPYGGRRNVLVFVDNLGGLHALSVSNSMLPCHLFLNSHTYFLSLPKQQERCAFSNSEALSCSCMPVCIHSCSCWIQVCVHCADCGAKGLSRQVSCDCDGVPVQHGANVRRRGGRRAGLFQMEARLQHQLARHLILSKLVLPFFSLPRLSV